MASDTTVFAGATLGVILGMLILLYGVSLNAGAALNAGMVAGGLVVLLSMAILALRIASLE